MRFTTLAWFYNAHDTLLHIKYLSDDPNTPNRSDNEFFGGTPVESFGLKLRLETTQYFHESTFINILNQKVTDRVPYWREELFSSAQLEMGINYHLTELWWHLTRGVPLSKIIIRHYEIDAEGQMIPQIEFTFKECWLMKHQTDAPENQLETYSIQFTYCCVEVHYFEGNRLAHHERCKAIEPEAKVSAAARYREERAKISALQDLKNEEAARLATPYPEYRLGAPVLHRFHVSATGEFNKKPIYPGGLDEIAFHIVDKMQTVDELIDYLYDNPSEMTRGHFKRVNNHLKNGFALPAQVAILTPEDKMRQSESEFLAQIKMQEIERARLELKIDPMEFSKNFINYANLAGNAATGMSVGTTYFQAHVKQVQKVLTELQEAYTKGFRTPEGSLRTNDLRAYRTKKFKEIDSLLTKAMQSELYGGMRHPNISKRVKINAKSIEHDWRIKQSRIIPGLSKFYVNTVNFANATKVAGYIAIPLAAVETHGKIVDACTAGEEACKKARYVQWAGFAGGVLGGSGAGLFQVGAFTSLVISVGASGLVAVAVVAGGTFAVTYGVSKASEKLGEYIGTVIYEKTRDLSPSVLVETIDEIGEHL